MKSKVFRAIGLMSGTSIDGIDAALVETDGYGHVQPLGFVVHAYEPEFRELLRQYFKETEDAKGSAVEKELTILHAALVHKLLESLQQSPKEIDVIGFHGQTLWHDPAQGKTCQIGDGALLAKLTGIPVVNDFRSADMQAGGQGAPLVPLFHRALSSCLPKPMAILNIGGVSNITWIGGESDDDILAFDVGPGNAPLDDWMLQHTGQAFDEFGKLASTGAVHANLVDEFLSHEFFKQKPPKSLDRHSLQIQLPESLSPADGAATLTHMIARCVAHAFTFTSQRPVGLFVTGGGRLNTRLMRNLAELTNVPVHKVDELGWNGDALEAEAFAYLAVRSRLGLPLSLPTTTGVSKPCTGGVCYTP